MSTNEDVAEGAHLTMSQGYASTICKEGHLFCQPNNMNLKTVECCPICKSAIDKRFFMSINSTTGNPFNNLVRLSEENLGIVPIFMSVQKDKIVTEDTVDTMTNETDASITECEMSDLEKGETETGDPKLESTDSQNRRFIDNLQKCYEDKYNGDGRAPLAEKWKIDWQTKTILLQKEEEKCDLCRTHSNIDETNVLWKTVPNKYVRPEYTPRVIPPQCTQTFKNSCDKLNMDFIQSKSDSKGKKDVNLMETVPEINENAKNKTRRSSRQKTVHKNARIRAKHTSSISIGALAEETRAVLQYLQYQKYVSDHSRSKHTQLNYPAPYVEPNVPTTTCNYFLNPRTQYGDAPANAGYPKYVLRSKKPSKIKLRLPDDTTVQADLITRRRRRKHRTPATRAQHLNLTNTFEDMVTSKISYVEPIKNVTKLEKHRRVPEESLSRQPVKCPLSSCDELCFISNIARHMQICHSKIPLRTVYPGDPVSFYYDPKTTSLNGNKCIMLFLLGGKIKNLDNGTFKDFVPIMVMASRVQLNELIKTPGSTKYAANDKEDEYIMIWVTGLKVQVPIYYSLSAWMPERNSNIGRNIVMSSEMITMREPQDGRNMYKQMTMMLSRHIIYLLTDNERNMINLQLTIL